MEIGRASERAAPEADTCREHGEVGSTSELFKIGASSALRQQKVSEEGTRGADDKTKSAHSKQLPRRAGMSIIAKI